jgi:phospholipid transport system substrate-binding protein
MRKTAGGWKAFDVSIEGVSMVNSYRGTFGTQIEQNGIDGLIKTLADKNASADNVALQKTDTK